ncbi:MAG: polyprenyl synthetase family protein [Deltaproteobacteria bacterium]|nr:polyprenyl synthetase family protein [Deltaproteobacteria bacterium]
MLHFPQRDHASPKVETPDPFNQFNHLLEQDLEQVEKEITRRLQSQVPAVTQVAQHLVASGGKRLRPILLLLVARALDYHGSRAIPMAAAVEFVHTATLLHDDVIDHAQLRRGRPSCNALWDNKMSVLVGDFLYCQVSTIIAEDGDLNILKCITDATTQTTEGEVLEITKSRDLRVREAEYFKIIEFKTGMLMSAATEMGAILAQADPKVQASMRQFGMDLGMAFQLADDVLDYTSVEEEFGKAKGVDLKEGKLTLPLLVALDRCEAKEAETIRQGILNASSELFKEVLKILKKYQAIEHSLEWAEKKLSSAREQLACLPDGEYREALETFTYYVTQRRK